MKKNLLLLFLCILLATFTYFFQEKKDQEKRKEKELNEKLLSEKDLGELQGFEVSKIKLFKRNGSWRLEDGHPASTENIETFFEFLSRVKVLRRLKDDEVKEKDFKKQFESTRLSFFFNKETLHFSVGEKLRFSRGFYMEVSSNEEKEYLIAQYIKPDLVYNKEDAETTDIPYKEFLNLFSLNKDFFRDLRLEAILEIENIDQLDLKKRVSRDVSLSFSKETLNPSVPEGKSLNLEFIKGELLSLLSYKAKASYDLAEDQALELKAQMLINSNKQISLFGRYKERTGYFVRIKDYSRILEYNAHEVKFFFTPFQEFFH